jgi:hypothetical protein
MGTMNRTLRASAATVVALGLTCCARQPEVAQHTVAEYRANGDLRREQFARCTNDPGTLGKTPDCINAREAERQEDIGSVRDTPPIGLPRPGGKH